MNGAANLKPCPFCGKAVKMDPSYCGRSYGFYHLHDPISLDKCPVSMGVFVHTQSKEEAIETWNTRPGEVEA